MSLSDNPLLLRNSALRSGVVFCTSASWRNFLACSSVSSRVVVCSAAGSAAGCASGCAGAAASTFCSLSLSMSPIVVDPVGVKKLNFERLVRLSGGRCEKNWMLLSRIATGNSGLVTGYTLPRLASKAGSRGAWVSGPSAFAAGGDSCTAAPPTPGSAGAMTAPERPVALASRDSNSLVDRASRFWSCAVLCRFNLKRSPPAQMGLRAAYFHLY